MNAVDEYQRQQAILLELESAGTVGVGDLAKRFGVSAVTVRKDLDTLERRNLLRRIRGGAVTVEGGDEGAWEMRVRHSAEAKQAIAEAAAEFVKDGDSIALDSSTTAYYLAQQVAGRRNLVVVTNGLRVAQLLMESSSAMVVLTGGVLRRSSESMVGPLSDMWRGRGRIRKGFFGLVGLSTDLGLLDVSIDETHAKSLLVSACDQVYGLFDASKATRFALHSFAPTDKITGLVTDAAVDPTIVRRWREAGVGVTVAELRDAEVRRLRPGGTP